MMDVQAGAVRRSWMVDAVVRLHQRRPLSERQVADRPLLDTIRWVAALLVALGHVMGLIFTRHVHAPGQFHPLDFIADLRGPAVGLFFVISGYLVGGGVLERAPSFRWKPYAIARFSRIYIVLVPAILLVCLLDGAAHLIDPASPVYAGVWPSGVLGAEPIDTRYAPINWIATILSLGSILAEPAGTSSALWSLGYEWVFYFAFPLIVVPFARFRSHLVPLLPIGIVLFGLAAIGRHIDAGFFATWLAGAYARVLTDHATVPAWLGWSGVALMIAALVGMQFGWTNPFMLLFAAGFALYLSRRPVGERGLSRRIDQTLADFSYSLYVTHFPLVIFLAFLLHRAGVLPVTGLPFGPLSVALVVALVAAAMALAYLFGRLFEANTDRFRAWLGRR